MGDHLKKVKVGERLEVPAKTFNTFIDAARDFQDRTQDRGGGPRGGNGRGGLVLVKNTSGADCDRFDVLGVDGVVFSPTTYPDSFKNHVAVEGETPATASHTGKFVILAEPVADGEIGLAFISGVCPVKIDITNTDHAYADIDNGDTGNLNSSETGAAQILWAESGTGEKWAIVRLGSPGGGGTSASPKDLLPTGANFETETAQADTWDRASQGANDGLKIRLQTRMAYNHSGDEKLYAYYREFVFDSTGNIKTVSAETRKEIDAPDTCT